MIPEVPSEEDLSWGRKLIALYQKEMSYAGEMYLYQKCSLKKCQLLVRKKTTSDQWRASTRVNDALIQ